MSKILISILVFAGAVGCSHLSTSKKPVTRQTASFSEGACFAYIPITLKDDQAVDFFQGTTRSHDKEKLLCIKGKKASFFTSSSNATPSSVVKVVNIVENKTITADGETPSEPRNYFIALENGITVFAEGYDLDAPRTLYIGDQSFYFHMRR